MKKNQNQNQNNVRINHRIRVPEIRVVNEEGEQLGVMATRDAMQLAQEAGLDLVEVAPRARPPVCRIMDYGKYRYLQSKRASESRKKQATVTLKEVKFRPKIGDHDLETKVNHVRRFIEAGNKVKCTVRFRGREHAHTELGTQLLVRVGETTDDVAQIESRPRMEGRMMIMILAPRKKSAPSTT